MSRDLHLWRTPLDEVLHLQRYKVYDANVHWMIIAAVI